MMIPKFKYRIIQNQGTGRYTLQVSRHSTFFYWWIKELVILLPILTSSIITVICFFLIWLQHDHTAKDFYFLGATSSIPFLIVSIIQWIVWFVDFRWDDIAHTDKDPMELDRYYQEHKKEIMRRELSNTYKTIVRLK